MTTQLLTVIYKLQHTKVPACVLGLTVEHSRTNWTRHGGRWNIKHADATPQFYNTTVKCKEYTDRIKLSIHYSASEHKELGIRKLCYYSTSIDRLCFEM